eukprot:804844-Amphidinium_carterae.1
MYWSPYRPTMLKLKPLLAASVETLGEEPSANKMYLEAILQIQQNNHNMNPKVGLNWPHTYSQTKPKHPPFQPFPKATDNFCTEFGALGCLDGAKKWHIKWWKIETAERPLAEVKPWIVSVVANESGIGDLLWPPLRKKRIARGTSSSVAAKGTKKGAPTPTAFAATNLDLIQQFTDAGDGDDCDDDVDEALASEDPGLDEEEHVAEEHSLLDDLLLRAATEQFDLEEHVLQDLETDMAGHVVQQAVVETMNEQAAIPEPPPPPADARGLPKAKTIAASRTFVGCASIVCSIAGGRLAYYDSKECFEATCPSHKGCKLTRTVHGKVDKTGKAYAGRPLGAMCIWLEQHSIATSKAEHKVRDSPAYSRSERLRARRALASDDDHKSLLAFERTKQTGEDSEPETLKGLA